jgi:hypothetical protein
MKRSREPHGILAGERYPHGVIRAAGVAGDEHALYGRFALAQRCLESATLLGNFPRLGAQRAAFALERGEGAVGLRDGPLRGAQRIARFFARLFLVLELLAQLLDAAAKRPEVFLFRRAGAEREKRQQNKKRLEDQAFAFPWLTTAAVRLATSAASPR